MSGVYINAKYEGDFSLGATATLDLGNNAQLQIEITHLNNDGSATASVSTPHGLLAVTVTSGGDISASGMLIVGGILSDAELTLDPQNGQISSGTKDFQGMTVNLVFDNGNFSGGGFIALPGGSTIAAQMNSNWEVENVNGAISLGAGNHIQVSLDSNRNLTGFLDLGDRGHATINFDSNGKISGGDGIIRIPNGLYETIQIEARFNAETKSFNSELHGGDVDLYLNSNGEIISAGGRIGDISIDATNGRIIAGFDNGTVFVQAEFGNGQFIGGSGFFDLANGDSASVRMEPDGTLKAQASINGGKISFAIDENENITGSGTFEFNGNTITIDQNVLDDITTLENIDKLTPDFLQKYISVLNPGESITQELVNVVTSMTYSTIMDIDFVDQLKELQGTELLEKLNGGMLDQWLQNFSDQDPEELLRDEVLEKVTSMSQFENQDFNQFFLGQVKELSAETLEQLSVEDLEKWYEGTLTPSEIEQLPQEVQEAFEETQPVDGSPSSFDDVKKLLFNMDGEQTLEVETGTEFMDSLNLPSNMELAALEGQPDSVNPILLGLPQGPPLEGSVQLKHVSLGEDFQTSVELQSPLEGIIHDIKENKVVIFRQNDGTYHEFAFMESTNADLQIGQQIQIGDTIGNQDTHAVAYSIYGMGDPALLPQGYGFWPKWDPAGYWNNNGLSVQFKENDLQVNEDGAVNVSVLLNVLHNKPLRIEVELPQNSDFGFRESGQTRKSIVIEIPASTYQNGQLVENLEQNITLYGLSDVDRIDELISLKATVVDEENNPLNFWTSIETPIIAQDNDYDLTPNSWTEARQLVLHTFSDDGGVSESRVSQQFVENGVVRGTVEVDYAHPPLDFELHASSQGELRYIQESNGRIGAEIRLHDGSYQTYHNLDPNSVPSEFQALVSGIGVNSLPIELGDYFGEQIIEPNIYSPVRGAIYINGDTAYIISESDGTLHNISGIDPNSITPGLSFIDRGQRIGLVKDATAGIEYEIKLGEQLFGAENADIKVDPESYWNNQGNLEVEFVSRHPMRMDEGSTESFDVDARFNFRFLKPPIRVCGNVASLPL